MKRVLFALILLSATLNGFAAERGPSFDSILSRSDGNNDGKLARDEFRGPSPFFDRLDLDRDGFLTREEFDRRSTTNPADGKGAKPESPNEAPPEPVNAPEGFTLTGERWTYREGDFAMSGILLKPEGEGPFPAVLISHGLGGSASSFGLTKAREMAGWGLVCIAPDYTHSGGVRGGPSTNFGASAENLRRAKTCLELVSKMPEVDPKRLAAYGHSMGGFVTIGLAGNSPDLLKAAAITGSGISSQEGYPAPSEGLAGKVRTPFLILHGSNDTVVRPEQSASFKEILDQNKVANIRTILEGEGHPIDQSKREEVFSAVRNWFGENGVLP